MSEELKICPVCECPYGYKMKDNTFACPECSQEWETGNDNESEAAEGLIIKDVNGNILQDGDTVIVIKDLPVKGAHKPVKAGTKVKNIRLRDADHDIDCKISGFGQMGLKSQFVRKA